MITYPKVVCRADVSNRLNSSIIGAVHFLFGTKSQPLFVCRYMDDINDAPTDKIVSHHKSFSRQLSSPLA